MTACLAAEAGRDVLVLEEGAHHPIDSAPSFSLAEMDQKYRNAGLNVTFGGTSITYLEGRCVGGGSEINAALYHRPLEKPCASGRLKRAFVVSNPNNSGPTSRPSSAIAT